MEGGGRKRGKLDRANGASAGGKRARETESFQTGVGSKSKPCTKIFSFKLQFSCNLISIGQYKTLELSFGVTGPPLLALHKNLRADVVIVWSNASSSFTFECISELVAIYCLLWNERVIILKYQNARLATSRILKRHRIQTAMSTDLVNEQATNDVIDRRLPGFVRWLGRLLFGSQF